MHDVTLFKLVAIGGIWLVGLVGGLLPGLLARRQHESALVRRALSVLNAFSGGVFLAGGFCHLLHAAIENDGLRRWSELDDGRYAFPYAEMFSTVGFLGLLVLEQVAHAGLHGDGAGPSRSTASSAYAPVKSHDHHDDEDVDDVDALSTDRTSEMTNDDDYHLDMDPPHGPRHHTHGGGGHSHLAGVGGSQSPAVAMVLFAALSFHSVLEGLGIGAQSTAAWGVFLAIILHKGLAAFALGTGLVQSTLPAAHVLAYMVVFSFMSIIGILVGWGIAADSSEDSAAAGVCVALASGTFIYVAVMEVLPQEFPRHGPSGAPSAAVAPPSHKLLALCLGYGIFGLLAKWS